MLNLKVLLIATMAILGCCAGPHASPGLLRNLAENGRPNVFVVMSETTAPVLDSLKAMSFKSRGDRLTTVATTLKSHAARSQKAALEILSTFPGLKYESLWINNQIYISGATIEVINKLATLDEIIEIKEELLFPLPRVGGYKVERRSNVEVLAEPGVEKIQAHLVWEMQNGTRGEGMIVAEMTTGVRRTHEILRDNYVGDYGWFDPDFGTAVPDDRSGIGTFSTGLMAGQGGIGVAPAAKWMACRGCGEFSCSQANLFRCGEFIACPTLPSGGSPDCTKAPHVVVNNWGGGGSAWYEPVVDTWHAAGITPTFVNGINGPDCETAGASENVVATGAVHLNDTIYSGSSRGPSQQGKIMPDVVAPGVGIRSADATDDSAYRTVSSTTPANCLVTGTIALMRSVNADLTFTQIREFLYQGADKENLPPSGGNCGGIDESVIPNNAYGYGRVNAYNSVRLALNAAH